jgi:CrcB protein
MWVSSKGAAGHDGQSDGLRLRRSSNVGFLVVFLGSGIGGVARHGIDLAVARTIGMDFPFGTLVINVFGSFLIGVIAGYFAFKGEASQYWRLFLTTGILGGFTTFSAFSLETVLLYERGEPATAALYVLASVGLAVAGSLTGLSLLRYFSNSSLMAEHFGGDGNERRADPDGSVPLAWLWSQCKGELPQGESGRRAEGEASIPPAWVSSQYKGEFPQTASEQKWVSQTGSAGRVTGIQNGKFAVLGVAAAFIGIGGLIWLFTAGPMSSSNIATTPQEEALPSPSGGEARPPTNTAAGPEAGEDVAGVKSPSDVAPGVPQSGVEGKLLSFLEHGPGKEAVFDLDRISFDAGKATLTASSHEQLERLAKILSAFPKARVVIGVHSDSGGNKAQNVKLSLERAKSVRRELVRLGVGQSLFTSKG